MTYVIAEACVDHMDQSCVSVCPVDCISSEPGIDRKFYIDPDGCIECGSCISVCPNDAIYSVGELPAPQAAYAWVDAAWYRDRATAREVLEEILAGRGTP
jgi:NAD-dependent dihydropyrimidine dehydrogenase PreA subunit